MLRRPLTPPMTVESLLPGSPPLPVPPSPQSDAEDSAVVIVFSEAVAQTDSESATLSEFGPY